MITCELLCDSLSLHLEQLHTGLVQLHRRGFLRLKQRICRPPRDWIGLAVRLNGRISVYFDAHDGPAIQTDLLDQVDHYFKRSFVATHRDVSNKIHPLGLNYLVYNEGFDALKIARDLSFASAAIRIRRLLKHLTVGSFPVARQLEALPDFEQPPRVLLMTRVWSPHNLGHANTDAIEALNWTRVQCIRLLRRELGSRFFGGVAPDDFACRHFSDLVLDPRACEQREYLRTLRGFPICVASRGLWDSNGWRLGEYVAQSKAIVSERLAYEVPGDFAPERNYLEFSTPEECVAAVVRLVGDRELRHQLSMNNFRYYQAFLKPDSLVCNILSIALGQEEVLPKKGQRDDE